MDSFGTIRTAPAAEGMGGGAGDVRACGVTVATWGGVTSEAAGLGAGKVGTTTVPAFLLPGGRPIRLAGADSAAGACFFAGAALSFGLFLLPFGLPIRVISGV